MLSYRESPHQAKARLRERLRDALSQRFVLRAHMALIVLLTTGVAAAASRALRAAGIDAMAWRYALAIPVAYGAFLALFRLWLAYFTASLEGGLDPATTEGAAVAVALAARPEDEARKAASSSSLDLSPGDVPVPTGGGSSGGSSGPDLGGLDGDAAAVVVVVALVAVALAVLGAAGWIVYQAPALFTDAAFELVLAAALARSARRASTPGWTGGLVRATLPALAVVWVVSVAGGATARWACPAATTMPEAVRQCVLAPRAQR